MKRSPGLYPGGLTLAEGQQGALGAAGKNKESALSLHHSFPLYPRTAEGRAQRTMSEKFQKAQGLLSCFWKDSPWTSQVAIGRETLGPVPLIPRGPKDPAQALSFTHHSAAHQLDRARKTGAGGRLSPTGHGPAIQGGFWKGPAHWESPSI